MCVCVCLKQTSLARNARAHVCNAGRLSAHRASIQQACTSAPEALYSICHTYTHTRANTHSLTHAHTLWHSPIGWSADWIYAGAQRRSPVAATVRCQTRSCVLHIWQIYIFTHLVGWPRVCPTPANSSTSSVWHTYKYFGNSFNCNNVWRIVTKITIK